MGLVQTRDRGEGAVVIQQSRGRVLLRSSEFNPIHPFTRTKVIIGALMEPLSSKYGLESYLKGQLRKGILSQ